MRHVTEVVRDVRGLHAVLATMIAKKARQFQSHIYLTNLENGYCVLANSALGILSMGTTKGTVVLIEACGSDEAAAIKQIRELVSSNAYMRHSI